MTANDFLKDSYFIVWKLSKEPLEDSYWESYLKKHPEHLNAFNEACLKLDSVQFEMTTLKSSQRKSFIHEFLQLRLNITQITPHLRHLFLP